MNYSIKNHLKFFCLFLIIEFWVVSDLISQTNPVYPTTTINYAIPEDGTVSLKVYDMLGREVANLVNEKKSAGFYKVNFNASKLASGVYFYSMRVNNFLQSRKMVVTK